MNIFNTLVYSFLLITCIVYLINTMRKLKTENYSVKFKHHVMVHLLDVTMIMFICIIYIVLELQRVINDT